MPTSLNRTSIVTACPTRQTVHTIAAPTEVATVEDAVDVPAAVAGLGGAADVADRGAAATVVVTAGPGTRTNQPRIATD
jgi:hypothetical protein